MRRNGSYIAAYIDREYRERKAYEERQKRRVRCQIKDCNDCQYQRICEDKEDDT